MRCASLAHHACDCVARHVAELERERDIRAAEITLARDALDSIVRSLDELRTLLGMSYSVT